MAHLEMGSLPGPYENPGKGVIMMDMSVFSSTDPQVTFGSGLLLLGLALVCGALGGAIGGILVGGKALGYELAASMGSFFGPIASVPGVLIGLLLLGILGVLL
jgi:hypothetical protein